MEVVGRRFNKERVRKKRILVIAGGANILLKTSEVFLIVAPVGRLRASREVVKVVIHDHTRHTIHATGLAGHGFSMFANIDDVVLENIVAQVELHQKLTGPSSPGVIAIERVVDDDGIFGGAPLQVVTPNAESGGMAGIDQIVACDHVTGVSAEVLASHFNTEVHIMHDVAFKQNSTATIDVDPVGIGSIAERRIAS